MSEGPPQQLSPREKYIQLGRGLFESHEHFPFPGIDPEAYPKIKATEEEFPGYTTPIDELIERFKNEGMKVVLGEIHESGSVFILPVGSENIEEDSIGPWQLQISEGMDERLKNLILVYKS
ncbi:MAG: hypothetical protein Q7S95_01090 [bacterium]|nr:hypothetical protein [bacterium]